MRLQILTRKPGDMPTLRTIPDALLTLPWAGRLRRLGLAQAWACHTLQSRIPDQGMISFIPAESLFGSGRRVRFASQMSFQRAWSS